MFILKISRIDAVVVKLYLIRFDCLTHTCRTRNPKFGCALITRYLLDTLSKVNSYSYLCLKQLAPFNIIARTCYGKK